MTPLDTAANTALESAQQTVSTTRRGKPKSAKGETTHLRVVESVKIDRSRDALLTEFGK